MKELAKQYDPSQVEDRIYQFWLDGGYFHTKADPDKKPYTIVMPPPNVTGQLHMGHAVDNTMQDILIRTKRMQGYAALWVPGTDHASIATEAKVVEAMRAEGLTKEMVGRDGFLDRAWAWKTKYGNRIVSQLKKLGSSCDWERERFTMDEGCSAAVKEVFVRLYDKGLIYRGNRMVNWCPHCNTSISDAEVEYEEKDGSFWHLLYPVKETGEMLELATTRPETMLGDTAVAINGDDPRYAHLHGCHVVLPLLNKEIPIVCDEHADMTKGTGVVKITPAHDPNDFEVGLRHNLDVIRVIADDGHINENGGKYNGMDRYECRKAIVKDLEEQGYLIKAEPYSHNVGTCYRCHNDVEPLISAQWFVKMAPLAKEAIRVVEDGTIKFVPERFTKTYINWMENVHDWCISRQLWWGHRIPAYYCDCCGETIVEENAPERCPKCGSTNLHQDVDVLDTWFSSGMWPFSTLGWPDKTPELKYYYPTSTLATGYDLIFFWIARMIMFGLYVMGDVPFDTVYIHGMVRDEQGRKMSKSLGNVVNPDDVVKAYGADTMRLYIMFIGDFEKAAPWNTSSIKGCKRFLERVASLSDIAEGNGTTKKLESILNKTVKKVSQDIEDMKFNTAIAAMMTCLNEINDVGTLTKDELSVFIRLLCPFAPHLCEEMWEQLGEEGLCSTAKWPDYDESKCVDDEIEIAVQVNGRVRDRFTVPADIEAADAIARAKELDKVREFTDGMAFIKELYVPGKLVNLVVKPQ